MMRHPFHLGVENGVKDQMADTRLLGGGEHDATDLNLVWVDIGGNVIHGSHVLNGAAQICREAHIGRHHLVCPEAGELIDLGGAPNQGASRRASVGQSGHDGLARLTGSARH